jgi:ABC-2 type transport system permease protein
VIKLLQVARAEYLKSVRTKGFILGVVLMPVLMGGGIIAMAIAEKAKDVGDRRFAVVDGTGALHAEIAKAAEDRNAGEIFEVGEDGTREQAHPRWMPEDFEAGGDSSTSVDVALSSRVESGELFGYLVIGSDIADVDGAGDRSFDWHTDTPSYDDLPDWLEGVVNAELRRMRFEARQVDAELVALLSRRENLTTMGLAHVDTTTGEVHEAEETNPIEALVVPAILAMMMFMLVMMSTPALLNNVLEEKMQKIAEVLVSSVRPFDLLMGKLLAAAGVSLTLGLLYHGAGLVFAHNTDLGGQAEAVLAALSPANLAWFVLFLVMSLLIFGSIFSAIGSACSEIQDAQSLMTPAMLVFILPMMFLGSVLSDPGSTLSRGLSLFPPATPMIMFLRVTIPPGVEAWELILALVLTVAFTLLTIKAAEKIFRIGILSQGQTPTLRRLIGWLLSK